MKRKWILYPLLALAIILVISAAGFVIWANITNPVMDEAISALQSDAAVTVLQDEWIAFTPAADDPTTGFIFYPGGKVDARAYAPLMRSLAEAGYLAVIVPMPLNLAFTGINRAADVMAAYPDIEHWVIGGHSLGGAMAANYVYNHPGTLDGLVLYASYPADSNNLAAYGLPVLSIYGTEDGLADVLAKSAGLLPDDALLLVIDGGNHAQFGYYGLQDGDGEAQISRADQQSQAVRATLEFLENLHP